MQRSSTRFIGCLWQRPRMLLAMSHAHFRCMASQGSEKPPNRPENPTSSSNSQRNTANRESGAPSKPTTTTTTTPTEPATTYTQTTHLGARPAVGGMSTRFTMREDSMWRDPQRLDTKWLSARDATRYKPDFKQTEPHSLRKQFMRSPDERTRDAMGRDWEIAMRIASNRRRQAILENEQLAAEQLAKAVEKGIGRHHKKRKPKAKKSAKKSNKIKSENKLEED